MKKREELGDAYDALKKQIRFKNVFITKTYFEKIMNDIKKQFEYDDKCAKAFGVILKNDHVSCYDNSLITESLLRFLGDSLGDYETLEFFVYELHFGEKYRKTSFKVYGKTVKLKTVDDLWDYYFNLNKNNNI